MNSPSSPSTGSAVRTALGLDDDLLAACVSCGLCLPHCPTYRATEEESASPRGRITLMRAVETEQIPLDDEFAAFMDRCVMCRACETACPSGVQFGELMQGTRTALAKSSRPVPLRMRLALKPLEHHRLVVVGSRLLAVAQKLRLVPRSVSKQFGLPDQLPVRVAPLTDEVGLPDAWLFTGCVMDAWQRNVHAAALRVMRATGARVALPLKGGDCCGALHEHAGLSDDAHRLAEKVMRAFPGTAPIVVDSAGCGAALKHYGKMLGTADAVAFSKRVFDVSEWVAERLDQLPKPTVRYPEIVAVQDPCHLRHVQRAHLPVRTMLAPFADIRELDDDGRCCGAGGSYQVTQPELAGEIRTQKLDAIGRSGGTIVASGNPGCSMWLAAAGARVVHPVEIVDAVLHGT